MSAAEQHVGRQSAATGAVRRQEVRSHHTDVRELLVQTFSAVIYPGTFSYDTFKQQVNNNSGLLFKITTKSISNSIISHNLQRSFRLKHSLHFDVTN